MFWFKQVFIVLLSFGKSLETKCVSFNNDSCMAKSTFIDFNLVELNYFPFMIILDSCNESCNAVDDLSTKLCVPSKIKNERISEATTLVKHANVNANSKVQHVIHMKNERMINLNASVKSIVRAKLES